MGLFEETEDFIVVHGAYRYVYQVGFAHVLLERRLFEACREHSLPNGMENGLR